MTELSQATHPLRILAGSAICPLAASRPATGRETGQLATIIERVHDGLAISGMLRPR
jgi:hypothetical protein